MARKTLAFALLACPPLAVAALSVVACGTSAVAAIALGVLSAFCFCDAWYFARMAWHALEMRLRAQALLPALPRRALFDTSTVRGRILLNDIDRNGHCNNARFLRECGFGRRDLWQVRWHCSRVAAVANGQQRRLDNDTHVGMRDWRKRLLHCAHSREHVSHVSVRVCVYLYDSAMACGRS